MPKLSEVANVDNLAGRRVVSRASPWAMGGGKIRLAIIYGPRPRRAAIPTAGHGYVTQYTVSLSGDLKHSSTGGMSRFLCVYHPLLGRQLYAKYARTVRSYIYTIYSPNSGMTHYHAVAQVTCTRPFRRERSEGLGTRL